MPAMAPPVRVAAAAPSAGIEEGEGRFPTVPFDGVGLSEGVSVTLLVPSLLPLALREGDGEGVGDNDGVGEGDANDDSDGVGEGETLPVGVASGVGATEPPNVGEGEPEGDSVGVTDGKHVGDVVGDGDDEGEVGGAASTLYRIIFLFAVLEGDVDQVGKPKVRYRKPLLTYVAPFSMTGSAVGCPHSVEAADGNAAERTTHTRVPPGRNRAEESTAR